MLSFVSKEGVEEQGRSSTKYCIQGHIQDFCSWSVFFQEDGGYKNLEIRINICSYAFFPLLQVRKNFGREED